MGGPIRLRERRTVVRRRSLKTRLLTTGGIFAVLVGAACWAPLAPTALAPIMPQDAPAVSAPIQAAAAGPAAPAAAAIAALPVSVVAPAPTATPVPTPVVVPTLTAAGQNALNAIRSDRTAQWV